MHHLYEIGGGFAGGIVVCRLFYAKALADLKAFKARLGITAQNVAKKL